MKLAICAGLFVTLLAAAPASAENWDLYHREVWIQDRVNHGQKDGSLASGEAQRVQIQRSDKGVEETHRVFGGNVILQPFGKEQRLGPVQAGAMIHA